MGHTNDLAEFHWLIEVMQTVDVGVLVMDLEYKVTAWNGFMENNSGIDSAEALGKSIFEVFEDINVEWFQHKAETVIQLRNRAFTTWEQRKYVFKFLNNRPITGVTRHMYQNCTFIPVIGTTGEVQNLAVIVYDVTDIATSKMELKAANERLALLSRTDRLTELFNRGYWEDLLSMEFMRQRRKPRELALIMFDIDHFKKVNDNYGHQAGDDVIRAVSKALRDNSRVTDLSGRYGGEEFAVLLLDSDIDNAKQFAERLRIAVEGTETDTTSGLLKVTISLGVAAWHEKYDSYNEWLEAADQALYKSKEGGRNLTSIAELPTEAKAADS